MKREQVVSSNILSIGYDKSTSILEIEMKNNTVYQYFDVPVDLHTGIMGSDSKGKYLAAHIKGIYGYSQVANIPDNEPYVVESDIELDEPVINKDNPNPVPIDDVVKMIKGDIESGVCTISKMLLNHELSKANSTKDYLVNGFMSLAFMSGEVNDGITTHEVYLQRVRQLVNDIYASIGGSGV